MQQTVFHRSLDPMLICDDRRRFVDANIASCLFLRSSREAILDSRIDELAPPDVRADLDARWPSVRAPSSPTRLVRVADELAMPDGTRVHAALSVAGLDGEQHLVVIDFSPVRELADALRRVRAPVVRALTQREREVLMLVARGKTGADIAAELFLSPATIQTHVNNALLKLQAKNRSHGIAIAMSLGEIDLERQPGLLVTPFLKSKPGR